MRAPRSANRPPTPVVIGSMLAGGDSIDDTAMLRAGATGKLFDFTRAPSTIGSWLRGFRWHNVR